MKIICKDNSVLDEQESKIKIVASVKKLRCKELNKPPQVGEFPVYVEQFGSYEMYTHPKKIKEIHNDR